MAGDVHPLLRTFANDATLVLDGQHSWSGHHCGREAIQAFLERFLAERIRGQLHEILVGGPPWRTLAAARFTDQGLDPRGRVIYENHAMILTRIRWGRIIHQHIYEDTQRVAKFDDLLAAAAAPGGSRSAA
jgi:ketosteroid isomerase-like protein